MKITSDMAAGFFLGFGLSFLTIYAFHEYNKQQELNIANQALNSGMFNFSPMQNSSPSNNYSPNMLTGGL